MLNEGTSGASANSYFLLIAGQEGVGVGNSQLAQISLGLMQADFDKRSALGGVDLSVDDIQEYHRIVFADVANVSANAWTPNYYLNSFSTLAEREAAWQAMLALPGPAVFLMISAHFAPPTPADQAYIWALASAGWDGSIPSESNNHGPFSVSIGTGSMVGGDHTDNTISGTGGDDVLIGFDGADTFQSSAGADRYYGGLDDASGAEVDAVNYGSEQAGITIQLGTLQQDVELFAPLISDGHDVQAVKDGSNAVDVLIDVDRVNGSQHDDMSYPPKIGQ